MRWGGGTEGRTLNQDYVYIYIYKKRQESQHFALQAGKNE